jgi:hypothetical protein
MVMNASRRPSDGDRHDGDDWQNVERELRDASNSSARPSIDLTLNTFLDQRVLERLRAEYLEMPGMKLTIEQIQRLCGIEPRACRLVLDALVKASFLRLNSDGTYVRLTEGSGSLQRTAKAALQPKPFVTTSRRAS